MSSRSVISVLLCVSVVIASCATSNAGSDITEIRLERSCSGCPRPTELVIRRDGTVTFTQLGNARFGTENATTTATISIADFDELASFLATHGFFELQDEYADPQIQDGRWTSIAAVRGGVEKKVMRRNWGGPKNLADIERAINELARRVVRMPPNG